MPSVPIFIGHGSVDPVVPQTLGMLSRDFLRAHGYTVDWHSYPMAHQVCAEEIADLRSWLGDRMASGRMAALAGLWAGMVEAVRRELRTVEAIGFLHDSAADLAFDASQSPGEPA